MRLCLTFPRLTFKLLANANLLNPYKHVPSTRHSSLVTHHFHIGIPLANAKAYVNCVNPTNPSKGALVCKFSSMGASVA